MKLIKFQGSIAVMLWLVFDQAISFSFSFFHLQPFFLWLCGIELLQIKWIAKSFLVLFSVCPVYGMP